MNPRRKRKAENPLANVLTYGKMNCLPDAPPRVESIITVEAPLMGKNDHMKTSILPSAFELFKIQ